MKKNAIFVQGEYYLIPDEFADFNTFINYIRTKGKIKINLSKLNEQKCMAPYFVEDAVTIESLELTKDTPIFSADVELMNNKEYHNRLLEAVLKVCPGCERYTDDGDYSELSGHHEEISLDKVCLIREGKGEEGFYELFYGLEEFCEDLVGLKPEIEKLINESNETKANETLAMSIYDYIPTDIDFVLTKKKKEYICHFTCLNSDACLLSVYYICKFLNNKKIENWRFVPYFPAGLLKTEKEDLPLIFKDQIEIGNGRTQSIINFCMKNSKWETFRKAYLAIVNEIGEDKLLNATADSLVWFTTENNGEPVDFEKFKKEVIKTKTRDSFFADGSPVPVSRNIASYDSNNVPEKLASYCSELFFYCFDNVANVFDETKDDNDWIKEFRAMGISVAKLKIKIDDLMHSQNIVGGIRKTIDKILNNNYSFVFAKEFGKNELCLYFFVADYGKFLMEVKRHSPVFMDFYTELELSCINWYRKYKVDFNFECLENKPYKNSK